MTDKKISEEKISDKTIKNTLDGLFGAFEKMGWENNPEVKKKIHEIITKEEGSLDEFFFEFIYPLKNALDASVFAITTNTEEDSYRKASFLIMNYNFIENNLTKFIIDKEGSVCSVDKASSIMRGIFKTLINGGKKDYFEFFDEKGEPKWYMPGFWNKNNGQEWLELFESLISLYYGNYQKYIVFLKKYLVDETTKK
jgi:hypothetical protein